MIRVDNKKRRSPSTGLTDLSEMTNENKAEHIKIVDSLILTD
jgi:hypothetical protein